jgi:TatA/E family protein of Tat protein translocase
MSLISPVLAFGFSTTDAIVIMFVCLLMFGSKKLPELAKAMGQAMREFKKASNEVEDNFRSAIHDEDRKKLEDERRRMEEERRRAGAPAMPVSAEAQQTRPPEKL